MCPRSEWRSKEGMGGCLLLRTSGGVSASRGLIGRGVMLPPMGSASSPVLASPWEDMTVLSESPISPILLATDLAAAKEFYHGKLGLEILRETDEMIVFKAGGGTKLNVSGLMASRSRHMRGTSRNRSRQPPTWNCRGRIPPLAGGHGRHRG